MKGGQEGEGRDWGLTLALAHLNLYLHLHRLRSLSPSSNPISEIPIRGGYAEPARNQSVASETKLIIKID